MNRQRDEVHENRLGKTDLKLNSYDMRRNELCKVWGWGVHQDKNGKLALVGCETDEYRRSPRNPIVQKVKALNPSAAQLKSFHNKFPNFNSKNSFVAFIPHCHTTQWGFLYLPYPSLI